MINMDMNMNLIELFETQLGYNYTKDTLSSYRSDLTEFLQFMSTRVGEGTHIELVKQVEYLHGLNYVRYLNVDKQLSPFSTNRKLSAINTFLDFCVKIKVIDHNNIKDIDRMKTKSVEQKNDYLTKDEYDLLLRTIQTKYPRQRNFEFTKARDLFLYSLILSCGLRITETVTLTFEQIDRVNKCLNLVRKGGKRQLIPINDYLIDLLDDYIEQRNKLHLDEEVVNSVFVSVNGGVVTRTDCHRTLQKYCERANIKIVSNHDLRHTCATRMVEQGMNIKDVSEALGHSHLSTTSRYVHGDTSVMRGYMTL